MIVVVLSWETRRLDRVDASVDAFSESLASSLNWMRYTHEVTGLEVACLIGSVDGVAVAAIPCYRAERPGDVSRSYQWLCRLPGATVDYPRLFLGAVRGHNCQPATALLLTGLFELLGSAAAYLGATQPGLPVAALYVPVPASVRLPHGVARIGSDAVLDIGHCTSLGAYVAGLGKKRRQNARREMRSAQLPGAWSGPLDTRHVAAWASLLATHAARYGRHLTTADVVKDLESLRRCFGARLVCFGYRHAGHLRAVSVCIKHRGTLYMRSIGIDPAYTRTGLYSSVGYFEPIKWATSQGLRSINYGVNAARAKCLRGCRHRRLVGCAFDQWGHAVSIEIGSSSSADETDHLATCPRQV